MFRATNALIPLFRIVYSNRRAGGGAWALVPLEMYILNHVILNE